MTHWKQRDFVSYLTTAPIRYGPLFRINDFVPDTECHESPFPLTGLPFLEAFETDLFPLALDFDNIDIAVRREIVATISTDGMLS
jgi:hypothetical protein